MNLSDFFSLQMIIQELQGFPSRDAFWTFHTTIDKKKKEPRLSTYTEIIKSIRQNRKSLNEEHSTKAKEVFTGEQWDKHFSYKKSGKTRYYSSDSAIARIYRRHTHQSTMWDLEEEDNVEEDNVEENNAEENH